MVSDESNGRKGYVYIIKPSTWSWRDEENRKNSTGKEGLKKWYEQLTEEEKAKSMNFAQLMEQVALISPELRVRFSTSHPMH